MPRRGTTDVRRVQAQVRALPRLVAEILTAEVVKGAPKRMAKESPRRTGRLQQGWQVRRSGPLRVNVTNRAFYWSLATTKGGRKVRDIAVQAVQDEARDALPRAIAMAKRRLP